MPYNIICPRKGLCTLSQQEKAMDSHNPLQNSIPATPFTDQGKGEQALCGYEWSVRGVKER